MTKVVAEIFSQGEEVICGQTVDSNAAWLSQQLVELGFDVRRHTAVGDNLADLVVLIQEIARRADCCICSGGLGPTVDDLTRAAVSQATGQPLQCDVTALQAIEGYFLRRNREMPAINQNQALLPEGAMRIDNPLGTAPGFAMRFERCWFVFLPGVPAEMKSMFPAIRQQLLQRFTLHIDTLVTLRSVGIGESAIQQRLETLKLPAGVQLGFRAATDEVQTKLRFVAGFDGLQRQSLTQQVASLLGNHLFAIDSPERQSGDLSTVIGRMMQQNGWRLSVLETASQGLIAVKCAGHDWLRFSQFSANVAITAERWGCAHYPDDPGRSASEFARHLHVQQQPIECQLVQLYQGSLSDPQQAIVLYNALQTPAGLYVSSQTVAGSLPGKQNQAAVLALDLLRRTLQQS